jgi:hypothetical protein
MSDGALGDRLRRSRRLRWALDAGPGIPDAAVLAAALARARSRKGLASFAAPARHRAELDTAEAGECCALLLESLLVEEGSPVTVVGAPVVARTLAERWEIAERAEFGPGPWPDLVVAAGVLGRMRPSARRRLLAGAAGAGATLLVIEPVWPDARGRLARGEASGRPRSRTWWARTAGRAGLRVVAETRTGADGAAGMALRHRPAEPAPTRVSVREPLRVHVDDDLSLSTSFAWISASLALALHARGATVSIEPCGLSPALLDRRAPLRRLMGPAADAQCHLGWTHYWPQYRRELGGAVPLALFAVNHRFADDDRRAVDPWLASLARPGRRLAPISTFCRDVLVQAGVDAADCHLVPMGATGTPDAGEPPGSVPGAAGMAVLHVTNSADPERHGTEIALGAFETAFAAPGRPPATLVVRDYGRGSQALDARISALRARGLDVRYWPVFYDEPEMGRVLRAFDLLLAPFRGEGFGIKLLDAMAAGVPIVAPRFGGPADFLVEGAGYPVAFDLVPMRSGYDAERLRSGRTPMWAQPDPGAVAAALLAAAQSPDERHCNIQDLLCGFNLNNSTSGFKPKNIWAYLSK